MNKAVALLCAPIAIGVLAAPSADSRQAQDRRPNIVVLETDDQTVESLRVMANLKRLLVDQGVMFENSFVSFSLCCPSRATFLTGQYNHNNGVLGNRPPSGGYEKLDHSNTLAVWLQRAGYYTVHLGKYLNRYGERDPKEIPPGWSEWHGSIDPSTYNFYGYVLNEGGTVVRYGSDPASYQTDVYARKAVEIVKHRASSEQPFFVWVAFLAPHSGGPATGDRPQNTPLPAPRHRGRFAAEPLPLPPSFNERDVSDKPAQIRQHGILGPGDIARVTAAYRVRLESLLAVDEAVAGIVEALRASRELENTLIVFTSDNGFFHGEHRVPEGKVLLYEPSIRVPLIVRGPGVPAGLRLKQPVSNIDLAPTIVDAADAKAGRVMDGRSLLPLFRDPGRQWGRDLLVVGPGDEPASRQFTAIRTPGYLYVEHKTGELELYDLARDPDELQSRHADPAYTEMQGEFARRLARLRDCRGSACRAGAELAFSVRCSRGLLRARLVGPDLRLVERVDFLVGGRRVASDRRPPFAVATRRTGETVRALAQLDDGRLVTRDRAVRRCR